MFWGLIMEPHKRYSQVIKKAFHISMASLDLSNSDTSPSQIMCGYEGRNYLLCTLRKPDMPQCALDLYFEEGTTVSFATNGKGHVHLTGYLTAEDAEIGMEEEESDNESQSFEVQAQKKPRSKDDTEESQPLKKKVKKVETVEEEEDDSDDSDVDLDKLMNMSDGEEQSEEESGEEEEDSLDDEGLEEEEDEDEEDDGVEDEEEIEEAKVQAVMNGLGKKSKKNKKDNEETPKLDKQAKEKPKLKQTPGPKSKKHENGNLEEPKKKGKEEKKPKENQTPNSKKRTLPGGVVVEDLKEGQGEAVSNGKFVHVYYEGRLKSNNKVFDKTINGPGFGFRLGKGEVIKGLDLGVSGMKVGGKRRIICPPHLAYGVKGSHPVIPPNATLMFEVEVKKVK